MKRALIICNGFFGDHLFATSIAKKLRDEGQFDIVDYVIGWPQLRQIFRNDENINNVYVSREVGPNPIKPFPIEMYNSEFRLGPIHRLVPPAIEYQTACGVKRPSSEFYINIPDHNRTIDLMMDSTKVHKSAPFVAVMRGWKQKSFQFNQEEYWRGKDVPYMGYGGRLRDIDNFIIPALREHFNVVMVGADPGTVQFDVTYDGFSFYETAQILKECDYYIGPEGGIGNLAAAIGIPCIIESNFVAQLYGPGGLIQRNSNPQLGPHLMFPDDGHSFLNPYLTDIELATTIIDIITENKPVIFDWSDI